MSLYLCVDCGGTKTSAVICNSDGTILGRGLGGPSNITYLTPEAFIVSVTEAVGNALKTTTSPPSDEPISLPPTGDSPFAAAWFGISGADSPTVIAKVFQPLSDLLGIPLGPRLSIANDTHLLAAPVRMHADVHHAITVIAGTGSITVSFKEVDGRIEELGRAGGWGWLLGDEGSGFDVGRETLRQILAENDKASVAGIPLPKNAFRDRVLNKFGVKEVMEIFTTVYHPDPSSASDMGSGIGLLDVRREKRMSSLPPLVFEAAFEEKDPLALSIVRSTAGHLASQVAVLLGEESNVPEDRLIRADQSVISFGGSLVGVEGYRRLILEALEARGHIFKHVAFIDDAAAAGAVGLAASFKV